MEKSNDFRDIKGFEGYYKINPEGTVINRYGRKKHPFVSLTNGDLTIQLSKDNKQTYHRISNLVAEAFPELTDIKVKNPEVKITPEKKGVKEIDYFGKCKKVYEYITTPKSNNQKKKRIKQFYNLCPISKTDRKIDVKCMGVAIHSEEVMKRLVRFLVTAYFEGQDVLLTYPMEGTTFKEKPSVRMIMKKWDKFCSSALKFIKERNKVKEEKKLAKQRAEWERLQQKGFWFFIKRAFAAIF